MKTPDFVIRRAAKKDKPAIDALIAKYPRELEQSRLPSYRDFIVAEAKGVIVACAALERIAEVRSVAVDPRYRGKKYYLGDKLVDACLDRAQRGRYKTSVLSTGVSGYFARFGFEIKSGSRTAMYLDLGNGKRKRPAGGQPA